MIDEACTWQQNRLVWTSLLVHIEIIVFTHCLPSKDIHACHIEGPLLNLSNLAKVYTTNLLQKFGLMCQFRACGIIHHNQKSKFPY